MSDTKAYEFSRIFRQGWNAGKKALADGHADGDDARKAALNPFTTAQESARWSEGFEKALASHAKPFSTPGGSGWRPAK